MKSATAGSALAALPLPRELLAWFGQGWSPEQAATLLRGLTADQLASLLAAARRALAAIKA